MAGESAARRRAEALVTEVLAPAGRPNPRWVRFAVALRVLAAGIAETGSIEALHVQRWIANGVRHRQTQHRVVAVVAGKGGVGATTTAWATATILATLRADTTALVSVHGDPASHRYAGVDGLEAVDVRSGPVDGEPTANDVFDIVDRLSNRHAFTLLDVGNDATAAAQAAILSADRAIVVTGTGPESIEHARLGLRRARSGRPADAVVEPVVAAVRTSPGPAGKAMRGLTEQLGLRADDLVTVPYDRELAHATRVGPALPSRLAQSAFVTLAALVAAGPIGQPSR
jgi:MinD-like ATPase involved in chromosome partitioning or flagellar assembly